MAIAIFFWPRNRFCLRGLFLHMRTRQLGLCCMCKKRQ